MTKNYALLPGMFKEFKYGQKVYGLHLNRLVRDILRENGYPTKSCDGCTEPDICDLLTGCAGGGAADWNTLANRPQNLLDIADITGVTGDILYFDGTNWVDLPIGADGNVLTVSTGIPSWAASAAGVSDYLSLTDSPANFGAGDDTVPTINTAGDALEHDVNDKFHNSNIRSNLSVFPQTGTIDSFTDIPIGVTRAGMIMMGRTQGEITPASTGAAVIRLSNNNTGAKYNIQNPMLRLKVIDTTNNVEIPVTYSVVAGQSGNAIDCNFNITLGVTYTYVAEVIGNA